MLSQLHFVMRLWWHLRERAHKALSFFKLIIHAQKTLAMDDDASREKAYPIGKYPAINQEELLVLRALAIQAYANLEFSLSTLFAQWLGTTVDVAGLVFFRITSTHARNRILNDLKQKRLGNQNQLFWNSLRSLVMQLDQRRNEIVHWHVVNDIDLSLPHEQASRLTLKPPAGWTVSGASINESDLAEFVRKCEFASRSVVMFSALGTGNAVHLDGTWLDIFRQPITYPPPDTHPLSPNYKAPGTAPQSSQG